MLTWARWITLALAITASLAWSLVSGWQVVLAGPSIREIMAPGKPRRYADYTNTVYDFRLDLTNARRADFALRVVSVLFISAHLVVLNLNWPRTPPGGIQSKP